MRVGLAPASQVLSPTWVAGRARCSPSPAVLSPGQAPSWLCLLAGRFLRGVWAFTWRARLPPGVRSAPPGQGGEAPSAEANLRRLSLPSVRGRSEGPHVTGAGGGQSRSHRGQEAAGPQSGPSQSGPFQGACLSCFISVFGDAVPHPGSCPTSFPIQFAAPVAWRASAPWWMQPGHRL